MKRIYQIIGVIFLAFIFTFGMLTFMPKVNADENDDNFSMPVIFIDENSDVPEIIVDPIDIICPAVCVPMWVISRNSSITPVDVSDDVRNNSENSIKKQIENRENFSCEFIECGSGCGVDDKRSFNTEEECKKGIERLIENNKPPVTPPGIAKRLGLQAKFTPALGDDLSDSLVKEGYIYDFSKIHLRVVSTEPITSNSHTIVVRMTENTNVEDSSREVYLKAYPLNLSVEDKENYENQNVMADMGDVVSSGSSNVLNIRPSNVEVYTQVSTTQGANISKQVVASVNERRTSKENAPVVEKPKPELKQVYIYNYVVSFKDNQKQIESVFGNDYKDKAYNIDISLVNTFSAQNNEASKEVIDSKKYLVKYSTSKSLPGEIEGNLVVQEQVRVSQGEISSQVSQAINKVKGKAVEIKSLDEYQVYTDENMTEMYISNKEKVRKIKPINQVLESNMIKAENVVGNVELVSVDDNPEYVLKVREKRKLLGFIPFGHREKYVSLNASEEISVSQEE